MIATTTLNEIRTHGPCESGWAKLLKRLGKTQADDEPLPLSIVLESNGLDDALWCLRACDGIDREARLFAVWCARQVQHLMIEQRSLNALDVAERYANGQATEEELAAARAAASVAARTPAAFAAREAARIAAAAAAREASWEAAWEATREASWAAAREAAWAAQTAEFRRRFCEA